jgi:uncharacterized protein (DUF983 family)
MKIKLKPCPACEHQISEKAALCPACGHRITFAQAVFSGVFWAVIVLVFLGFIITPFIVLLNH